jgi:hypothetical protein
LRSSFSACKITGTLRPNKQAVVSRMPGSNGHAGNQPRHNQAIRPTSVPHAVEHYCRGLRGESPDIPAKVGCPIEGLNRDGH